MRIAPLAKLSLVGILPLTVLAGCTTPDRQAAGDTAGDASATEVASADQWNNPVGSMWWTKDVHACVFNHTTAPVPISWYKRTTGDTNTTIAPNGSSCAGDGHPAFTTEHSDAQAQISLGGKTYWIWFENPPVGEPDLGVWRSYQSDIIASASLGENASTNLNVDGQPMTAKRLNDSSDAKELELHLGN